MAEPEVQSESTVHNQNPDDAAHAQAWRAHTRDSVPDGGATIIDITQRHRDRVAGRWGKPIVEPPQDTPAEPGERPQFKDVLNQIHLYRDTSPSMRAVLHDLVDGGRHAYEDGGIVVAFFYWAAGIPGHGLAWVGAVLKETGSRPGRVYIAGLIALALWVALAVAGLNPVPFSILNPF